jgi:hypothetical protein
MKTRYSSLVSVKKNIMQSSERVVQSASTTLQNANSALQKSYEELELIKTPQHGKITELLSIRTLLDSQRALIQHNKEWMAFASKELEQAKDLDEVALIAHARKDKTKVA